MRERVAVSLPQISFQSFDPTADAARSVKHPLWPTHDEIKLKLANTFADCRLRERDGQPATIIPGFANLNVGGIRVGHLMTSDEAFGDGSGRIVGARFGDDNLDGWVVFREPGCHERYKAHQKERRKQFRRVSDDPEKRIENAIADARRAAGHEVEQQVCVPGGIVDIVDRTARCVIECKAFSKTSYVMAAVDQLDRYLPHFEGYSQAIGLPDEPANGATSRMLARAEIAVLTPADPFADRRQS